MGKKPLLPPRTPEQIQQAAREAMLAKEARAVAERKLVRRARQDAAARFAEQNRERRARAHRLIRLGAEVEASGLSDLLGHDPEAVFGMLATVVENAHAAGGPVPVAAFAELGRERREKIAAAPPPIAESAPAGRSRKGRKLASGRIAIRFPSPPPPEIRSVLRVLEYRWRLGLRSWVGDEPLDEETTTFITSFGGEILPGPDAAPTPES